MKHLNLLVLAVLVVVCGANPTSPPAPPTQPEAPSRDQPDLSVPNVPEVPEAQAQPQRPTQNEEEPDNTVTKPESPLEPEVAPTDLPAIDRPLTPDQPCTEGPCEEADSSDSKDAAPEEPEAPAKPTEVEGAGYDFQIPAITVAVSEEQQEANEVPVTQAYAPYTDYLTGYAPTQPVASYAPVYGYTSGPYPGQAVYDYGRSVEGEDSYYRLDTCEYRFILDMVQCNHEESHTTKVKAETNSHQAYTNYGGYPYYTTGYPYQSPYTNQYLNFLRLYGDPTYYTSPTHGGHSHAGYTTGPSSILDSSLFDFQPSQGHPFYAPGLHNTPFARYYSGFRVGKHEQNHETSRRTYYKEGHYRSAQQDFDNLKLLNVANVTLENDASVKTSVNVSVSDVQALEGVTPYFNYNVRLLPNHCVLPSFAGKHTCIVFSGATHPYKKVQRQFIYVKKSREVRNKQRYNYQDQHRAQYSPYYY